jgi:hypothetical protein
VYQILIANVRTMLGAAQQRMRSLENRASGGAVDKEMIKPTLAATALEVQFDKSVLS